MKPGPKPLPPSVKAARGTAQPSRGAGDVEIIERESLPAQPDWLTTEGEEVWQDDVGRVAHGRMATERDSTLFGQYCNLAGACAKAWRTGEAPPASYLTELRRMAELFGLAGSKSRVLRGGGGKEGSGNPFSRNGKRQAG